MTIREKEIMTLAGQLLAGMLANPHIYTMPNEESGQGQQEHLLIVNAVAMAEGLIEKVKQVA
ncbi:hypothetical protein S7335_515 [Synechococcus sp. PCC 7335]|uniref:hypothetical protein n=1 Tax=Synechococcus sp. (strain ATCC 29403 / PCC 7335) TaxID=91464 RepID=UPI00017ECB5C|nr:hypothetical protein [Synechococcus sp. PCC 7335]EDX83335.1 hypothetical protein S7335_515 [Synechococcus sp. PCC 7335]